MVVDCSCVTLKSPAKTTTSSISACRSVKFVARRSSASARRVSPARLDACTLAKSTRCRSGRSAFTTWHMRRSRSQRRVVFGSRPSLRPSSSQNGFVLSVIVLCSRIVHSRGSRITFPWPPSDDRKKPGLTEVTWRPNGRPRRVRSPIAFISDHAPTSSSAQAGTSCRQTTSGRSAVISSIISRRYDLRPGGSVLPWKRVQLRRRIRLNCGRVRIVLADPPAYTPWYDHELARALAAKGAEVEVASTSFRFTELPAANGYRRSERFYPVSSRVGGRSRARLPLRGAEHLAVLAWLAAAKPDVLHVQWLAVPQLDVRVRFRAPAVFTAHDLLPRRTASKRDLWRRLLGRFDRVVVHTSRGADVLRELGVAATVIPHPVYPSSATRSDDGRTLLALGVIRPYKGLEDTLEVVRRLPEARLVVAGDPAMPVDDLRNAPRTDWRLGYLPQAELDRALGEATVAVFPYRAELDQSGALLRALGAGVPAVVYDVGGLPEPVEHFGAGRVVPAGDVQALADAVRELLGDPEALGRAREGAAAARDALTWDASAAAHLELYRSL